MQSRQRVQPEKVPEARYKKVCVWWSHKEASPAGPQHFRLGVGGEDSGEVARRPRCGQGQFTGDLLSPR